jgi:hypothetical protein
MPDNYKNDMFSYKRIIIDLCMVLFLFLLISVILHITCNHHDDWNKHDIPETDCFFNKLWYVSSSLSMVGNGTEKLISPKSKKCKIVVIFIQALAIVGVVAIIRL